MQYIFWLFTVAIFQDYDCKGYRLAEPALAKQKYTIEEIIQELTG